MKLRIITNSKLCKILKVEGIVIYPFVFLKPEKPSQTLLNHEMIHVKQIRYYGWFKYYISYGVEFLSYILRGDTMDVAYHKISYEKEAYANEHIDQEVG